MTYTADQLELRAHLEAGKAKALAWQAEDPANRMVGYATTDLDHWAKSGVFSVADYERYDLEATAWDLYKDVHGVRPRGLGINEMPNEELKGMIRDLHTILEMQTQREKDKEARAIEAFEARIEEMIGMGAADRETAIRWIREACDESWGADDDSIEYHYNLPIGYLKKEVA